MPTPEQVQAAVDGYVDAYRKRDRDAFLSLFTPDAVWHDPVGAPPHEGHAGIGAFWDQAQELSDGIDFELREIFIGGSEAAVLFTITATVGDGGMAFEAIEIFVVGDDGKITSLKAYWDGAKARPLP